MISCRHCDGSGRTGDPSTGSDAIEAADEEPVDAVESMSLALRAALEGDQPTAAAHYERARDSHGDGLDQEVEADIAALLDRTPRDTSSAAGSRPAAVSPSTPPNSAEVGPASDDDAADGRAGSLDQAERAVLEQRGRRRWRSSKVRTLLNEPAHVVNEAVEEFLTDRSPIRRNAAGPIETLWRSTPRRCRRSPRSSRRTRRSSSGRSARRRLIRSRSCCYQGRVPDSRVAEPRDPRDPLAARTAQGRPYGEDDDDS
jgi:hypothetical protein